jgi:hypothetical protein
MVTAAEMARAVGIDPKRSRQALRDRKFSWHSHNADWNVEQDSERHREMIAVLARLLVNRHRNAVP